MHGGATGVPRIIHALPKPPCSSGQGEVLFPGAGNGATAWGFKAFGGFHPVSPGWLVRGQQELTLRASIGPSTAAALARSPGKDLYRQEQKDKLHLCNADS